MSDNLLLESAAMIKIFSDLNSLNFFAAEKFAALAGEAIEARGKFTVALAGGSTPKALYQLLASEQFKNQIEWAKVFFFFGDERDVPSDADESNFRMANENILEPLKIPAENVFRWQTELAAVEKIAEDYEEKIQKFFDLKPNQLPRFDLILLGMGDDGHTASLFPHTAALRESKRLAVANHVPKFQTNRLTLTFPAINRAACVIFLVGGANKASILKEVLEGESQPENLPSQNVQPENGELFWLVDVAAARLLARKI